MDEQQYLTKEKHQTLSEELEYLRKVKRKEVAEQLEYAKSLGDLSENAEYHEARDAQGIIEDRIQKLESLLKSAMIVSSHSKDMVTVGSVIKVAREGQKETQTYTMVGGEESDLLNGKVSTHSPFGEAALGKKKGESFTFKAPKGPITYKIIEIQ